MKNGWSSPFEPWVIESWKKYSEENGFPAIADKIRKNLEYGAKISNDPSLTTKEKTALIRKGPPNL